MKYIMAAALPVQRSLWIAFFLTLVSFLFFLSLLQSRATFTASIPFLTSRHASNNGILSLLGQSGDSAQNYLTIAQRMQHLAGLIRLSEDRPTSGQWFANIEVEQFTQLIFPLLKHKTTTPYSILRHNFTSRGLKGITIPTSRTSFRSTLHLLSALRTLNCALPVQIAYSWPTGLPNEYREALTSQGANVSMLDLNTIFDLRYRIGQGSASSASDIKALAILATKFEKVIVLDPSTMLLQDPTSVFEWEAFRKRGVFLFGTDTEVRTAQERIDEQQQKQLQRQKQKQREKTEEQNSARALLEASIAHDEGEDGVLVLDKSRLEVLTAALFVAWQSAQQDADRMNWRASFELCTLTYAFSAASAAIGTSKTEIGDKDSICGARTAYFSAIAPKEILWYSAKSTTEEETSLETPQYQMLNQKWEEKMRANAKWEKCAIGGEVKEISKKQQELAKKILLAAKEQDNRFEGLISAASM